MRIASTLRAETATPEMEAAFLDKFKAALAHKDRAGSWALVCHDGNLNPRHERNAGKIRRGYF